MDTQQFMATLTAEAQAILDFTRTDGDAARFDSLTLKENAADAALDCFAAQVSQEDFVQMMSEVGAVDNNFRLVQQVAGQLE